MNYLLDANACITLINRRPEVVRARLEQALRRNPTLVTANDSEFRRVKGVPWQNWARGL
jgi:hypothetical protein